VEIAGQSHGLYWWHHCRKAWVNIEGGCDMIALLFSLFFVTAGLALRGKKSLALAGAYLSLFLSLLWFFHHASDELPILL
jgi:hypothetical protein